ncbi:MAG TPA: hypothetical protein VGE47_14295, partial [Burkholderiaceae bacterium]
VVHQAGKPGIPRLIYLAIMLAVALIVPWFSTRGAVVVARRWPSLSKLPNRSYWLAPERREATLAWMLDNSFLVGLPMLVVLGLVQYLVLQESLPELPRLAHGHLWVVGMAGLGVLPGVLRMQRHFRKLP